MSYPTQRVLAQRPDGHALDGTPGDCYRVCLAILLDVDVDQVPHVVQHKSSWWDLTRRTVRELRPGWDLMYVGPSPFPPYLEPPEEWAECQALAIAAGPSPRGSFQHCVVVDARTGDLVWDPHPSRAGLAGEIVGLDVLVHTYEPDPAPPIALPPAPPSAVQRVEELVAAGQVRLCRQRKPITEQDAKVLLEFHEQLSTQGDRA